MAGQISRRVRAAVLAVLTALTGGCAMQTVATSQASCTAFGFRPGSERYAECVADEQHRNTVRLRPSATPNVCFGDTRFVRCL
jgi:hypothetical protein